MARRRPLQSVTNRLALGVVAAGVALSVGAGYLTWLRQPAMDAAQGGGYLVVADSVGDRIVYQTLLIAAMSLSSLLLIRRWVAEPLAEVVELVDVGARHEALFELARQQRGEFARLSQALGEMVQQIDEARVAGKPTMRIDREAIERATQLVAQQKRQLQVLRGLGAVLAEAEDVEALLVRTAQQMFDLLGVDAVGVAVRDGAPGRRARQIVHRGTGGHLLAPNQELVRRVETDLLPDVLAQPDLLFWPDLDVAHTGWSSAFAAAGLTCLAAAGVRGSHDAQGVLWIAQRGGNRLESAALHLLETLAPVVAARLELAQLRERLQGLHLVDAVTGLPSHLQFEQAMRGMVGRPGQPCALIVIDLDHFRMHNQRLGTAGGDLLLRRVATRLLAASRRSSFLARFAGASYGLIMPGVDGEAARSLGCRLADVLAREPFTLTAFSDEPCIVTASIGVACFPGDGLRADELLDLALIRVAAAKRTGRNRVVADTLPQGGRQAG